MLDALVYRQNGQVAGAGQSSGVVHGLQAAQYLRVAIRLLPDPIYEIGAGEVDRLLGYSLTDMREQAFCFFSQQINNSLIWHDIFILSLLHK